MLIREIFDTIKNTGGSKKKQTILEANLNPTLEIIFNDTYDQSRKYFVHKYNKNWGDDYIFREIYNIDDNYNEFHEMLDALNERRVTGNAAIAMVEETIAKFIEEDRPILHAILARNLKIGVSSTSFNKHSDEKIEKFKVALACNLDKIKGVDPLDGNWFASRKLDGVRCIAIVDTVNQTVQFMSRQGKEFTSLSNLVKPMLTLCDEYSGKMVFDGELCAIDEDGNEDFSKAIQKVTKKDVQATDVKYCIFDVLSYDVFIGGKDDRSGAPIFSQRYNTYKDLYYNHLIDDGVSKYISILLQERITSQEDFDKWSKSVKDNGWEGFMLRKDLPYEAGRIKDLLKVKKFQDAEYIVEGVETGKVVYNEDGMKEYDVVRAIIIDHKGTKVHVGSGLSKEQRIEWFKDPSLIIGKTVTVQYFQESKNITNDGLSLRFPVLKFVYEDGRNV